VSSTTSATARATSWLWTEGDDVCVRWGRLTRLTQADTTIVLPGNDKALRKWLEDPKHGSVMVEFTQVSGDPVSVAVSKVEMRDGSAHIEVTLGGRKCSGRVLDSKSLVIPPSLFTGTADLVGVALLSDGAIAYRVGDMRQSVLIGDIADL
jgi:hypothetical protein